MSKSLRNMWEEIKKSNMHVTDYQERKEYGRNKYLKE